MKAVRFRAVGRVQGVSYRAFTRRNAEAIGIAGWVRNDDDGSVVGRAEGNDADLERFLEVLRQGPPGSRVDALQVTPTTAEGARGFSIRS